MDLIEEARVFVAGLLAGEPSSHDMSHITRVEKLCMRISEVEGGDRTVIRLAALFHDAGIVKEHELGGDHAIYGAEIANDFLSARAVEPAVIAHIVSCVRTHRFSRGIPAESIEARILQDADRLDALGAVGIFRALVSMGALRALKGTASIVKETSMNAYTEDPLHGFFEYMEKKPFKILERLNTTTAREIATERLNIMHIYLDGLKAELE